MKVCALVAKYTERTQMALWLHTLYKKSQTISPKYLPKLTRWTRISRKEKISLNNCYLKLVKECYKSIKELPKYRMISLRCSSRL